MAHSEEMIADWLARHVLPREAAIRARLRYANFQPQDIDDIIQEAYARIVASGMFSRIINPSAYFSRVVRNVVFDQLRRARIVRIENLAELDLADVEDQGPGLERCAGAKQDLERLNHMVSELPDRCREIFIMRKIRGLSQKEISRRLGVTENTVESQVQRGLRLILNRWAADDHDMHPAGPKQKALTPRMRRDARE